MAEVQGFWTAAFAAQTEWDFYTAENVILEPAVCSKECFFRQSYRKLGWREPAALHRLRHSIELVWMVTVVVAGESSNSPHVLNNTVMESEAISRSCEDPAVKCVIWCEQLPDPLFPSVKIEVHLKFSPVTNVTCSNICRNCSVEKQSVNLITL